MRLELAPFSQPIISTTAISWGWLEKKYNFLALIIMACCTNFLRIVIGSFLQVCLFCDWRLLQTALCFSSMQAMLFFFVYSLNGAKASFLLILRYPGSRHVFLCLAKDRHFRRWFSVKIQLLSNDIRP